MEFNEKRNETIFINLKILQNHMECESLMNMQWIKIKATESILLCNDLVTKACNACYNKFLKRLFENISSQHQTFKFSVLYVK